MCKTLLSFMQSSNSNVERTACVLVLTGTELVFSLAVNMGLYFGSVLRTVLIIQECFSYC